MKRFAFDFDNNSNWNTGQNWSVFASDSQIIKQILDKIDTKMVRYMEFHIMNERIISLMIERDYIKTINIHTKGRTIRGGFGVNLTGKQFRDMWGNFNDL